MTEAREYSKIRKTLRSDPARSRRLDAEYKKLLKEFRQHKLCDVRKSLEITQCELAKSMNVTQSTISQLENGGIEISITMLHSLIDHMGGELKLLAVFDDRTVQLEV